MALKTLLHHIDQFYCISLLTFLVLSNWFGQWRQTWSFASRSGFSMRLCFHGFFFWRSGIL